MADPHDGGLDGAATLLLAVGCADPFATDPAVRLRCLWAVERLRAVGARPERDFELLMSDQVSATIHDALAELVTLTPRLTEQPAAFYAVTDGIAALETLD
jgi:hypothetical protein